MRNRLPNARPTVGLLVPTVAAYDLWLGVVDAARERGANLISFSGRLLKDSRRFAAHANVIYELVDKDGIDGLIIWTSALGGIAGRDAIRNFCERYRPLPMVSIGMVLEGIPSVIVDSYQGMYDAVTHLIETHGRKRLAFIRGTEGHHDAEERYRAYLDALREQGLPPDPELISPPVDWRGEEGKRAILLLLDQRKASFDAVVATNDAGAVEALRVLQARGIRVPDDVAVVGFDNSQLSEVVTPPLTTVPLRMYDRGKKATEMLLKVIEGKPAPDQVCLPTWLLVRQSCGCLDPAVVQAVAGTDVLTQTGSIGGEPLAIRRDRILREMAQAAEAREPMPASAEQLLDAFLAELEERSADTFLSALEKILHKVAAEGGDVTSWQDVVSTLRCLALPFLLDEADASVRAENLWGQARVMIAENALRTQAYHWWQAEQQTDMLREISRILTTVTSMPELMDMLAQELPQVGIPGCYLSLYEDPQMPTGWSNLCLAYNERGRVELETDSRRFPSRQLVPDGLLPSQRPYNLVVEALHFREEQLGFTVFQVGPREGNVYDVLSEQISSAIKSTLLLEQNVQLYQEALIAKRKAEEADRLKSRFLSLVSHELRTPLSLLVGLSEMMLHERGGARPRLPEAYRQDLTRIHISAQQLDGLIRDVLDLARSQMGQLRLAKRPLKLEEVLHAVALVGEQMAKDKGLAWQVEIPEKLPSVWGDRTRLQQVVLNLVSNAVKFTPRGEVRLRAEIGEGEVTVAVSDTGLGVPLAEQDLIFDEFRQSERTAARGYGGLGVGLALCRQLVELHEGEIGIQSSGEEEGGSTFYFTLPTMHRRVPQEPDVETRAQTVLLLTRRAGSGARLLEHLMREGFEAQVLDISETPDWLPRVLASPPGVIMLDFQPAAERSWELIEVLRENPVTESIPVLFYSLLQEQDGSSVLTLDYLTKPLNAGALVRALRRQGLACDQDVEQNTVMVVDDDPGVLDLHTQIVQTQLPDCRVLKASNGREALAMMQQERPSLVLLDLMMPELDGFGVLEAMQESEKTQGIPVIVLTAQTLTEKDMARLNRGVAAVLEKGLFSTEETLAHVEKALVRSKRLRSDTQWLVRRAMAYIHENYAEPISRKEIALHVNISERYLTRCFRQETGVTPVTYLNRYRIKQAKALLEMGDRSITEIALEVGFSDSNYFGRVFRREEGMSPSVYRRDRRSTSD